MTKFTKMLSLVAVSGVLAAATPAHAEDVPRGWDTPALLFQFDNVFTKQTILSPYGGFGAGVLYPLSPKMALRVGLGLNHATKAAYVESTTTTNTAGVSTTTKSLNHPTDYTSLWGLTLGGDFLLALSDAAVMPYVGGGVGLGYNSSALAYKDDTTTNNVTKVDDSDSAFNVGLRGIGGVQWRVHKSFALYAEYTLGVTLISAASHKTSTSNTTPAGTTSTKTSGSGSNWLNFGTGLNQGASLGLVAFF